MVYFVILITNQATEGPCLEIVSISVNNHIPHSTYEEAKVHSSEPAPCYMAD